MAVDSRNRRMAMIGLGSPVPRVLPHPDGAFSTANDRYMLVFLYPIFTEVPPAPTPDAGGSSGAGRPWPQKLINVILPHRILIDDEDVLFIIMDD